MRVREAMSEARGTLCPIATIVALFALAYRNLWWQPDAMDVGHAVFGVGALPGPIVLVIGLWMLWRRRRVFLGSPPERHAPDRSAKIVVGLLVGMGSGLFVWAKVSGKTDLLFLSLAAHVLGWAIAARGWWGLRTAGLPAAVLLFGIQIPKPIEDEIIWSLQVGTARWSGWLLNILGREFFRAGVILRDADHTFHVIDTCSGLTGNLILLLVSICVIEILRLEGWRAWSLAGLAIPVGFVINILRVAYVAGSPDPEKLAGIGADHTVQGLAVLMGGSALLYLFGALLARLAPRESDPPSRRRPDRVPMGWKPVAGVLSILFILSLVVPRIASEPRTDDARPDLPERTARWTSVEAPPEDLFHGVVAGKFNRRYRDVREADRPLGFVDVLIGSETDGHDLPTRLFSSKRFVPGPDWNLVRRDRQRNWVLGREVDVAIASPAAGAEHAIEYVWRPRHRGILLESLRRFLGLEATPFFRVDPPRLVKLVAYAPHGGELALGRARKRLNRFVADFRDDLRAL